MPINRNKKALFIHIPKTAGTSIEKFFNMQNKNCFFQRKHIHKINGIRFCSQHLRYVDMKERLDNIDDYFSFSFVRNPYDRMVSEFFYRGGNKKHKNINKWVKKFINRNDEDHCLAQYEFICDENDNILVDFLGSFENLNEDFSKLADKLNLKKKKLPHERKTNVRKNKNYDEYLNEESKELIYERYKKDFELFGYKK